MSGTVSASLSEDEIERLAALLAANRNPDALSLEGVDGFFCALIASPVLVMPHEYLPVILGGTLGEAGLLGDFAGVQEMMGLLMRLWNAIAHDFEQEGAHMAYIEEPGIDGITGRAWARGYLCGTRLASHGWDRIFEDENEGLLLAVPLAAGEVDPAWPEQPLTTEQSSAMRMDMLAGAARAYEYFKEDRLAYAQATARRAPLEPYERADPKVGRNDPCPCGSGKKYKHCCGAAGSSDRILH